MQAAKIGSGLKNRRIGIVTASHLGEKNPASVLPFDLGATLVPVTSNSSCRRLYPSPFEEYRVNFVPRNGVPS
jgi:hypothetical protein